MLLSSLVYIIYLLRDKVVDFHWNASDPWTIVSVSDDCETTGGGGTLQVILKYFLGTSISNFIDKTKNVVYIFFFGRYGG